MRLYPIDYPEDVNQRSFIQLFGAEDFRDRVKGLAKQEREDAVVEEYIRKVKAIGKFQYVCTAIVLHPEIDRTAFHLIYATRNLAGVEAFKDAEKRAMAVMEKARAEAKQRKREEQTGQAELYDGEVLDNPVYYDALRARHLEKSKQAMLNLLTAQRTVEYDKAWALTLSFPLSWESDLKGWVREWDREGRLTVSGLRQGQRVPQRGQGAFLSWRASDKQNPRGQK